MSISKDEYNKMTQNAAPRSPVLKNCVKAFLIGGGICCLGEALFTLYGMSDLNNDQIKALVPVTFIILTAILTGVGIFDKIARHAGAGTVVPITGFANSVVCSAMEYRNEGEVLGVGAKIFNIAGPVILYGTTAAFVYGVIYWIFEKVMA